MTYDGLDYETYFLPNEIPLFRLSLRDLAINALKLQGTVL